MSNFLVTGGCGFIGSHLVEQLRVNNHHVTVLDNLSTGKRSNIPDDTKLIIGDIRDEKVVNKAINGMDGCFHLAAIASVESSIHHWCETHQANLTGAINVFNEARFAKNHKPIPVVYASSAAVYGNNEIVPLTENSPASPITAYGADKLGCELHGKVASIVHKIPTVGLRFFNVYGPRQDPFSPYSGVISIFSQRLASGEAIEIFGDGGQYRDFVYVKDVVKFLLAGMEKQDGQAQIYNVCTGHATSINALSDCLGELIGTKINKHHSDARLGDIQASLGNPSLAQLRLGIEANTSLRDGLAELIQYQKQK